MSSSQKIHREDAPLYIDVWCYECKRRATLSNTTEDDGRRYCGRCRPVVTLADMIGGEQGIG